MRQSHFCVTVKGGAWRDDSWSEMGNFFVGEIINMFPVLQRTPTYLRFSIAGFTNFLLHLFSLFIFEETIPMFRLGKRILKASHHFLKNCLGLLKKKKMPLSFPQWFSMAINYLQLFTIRGPAHSLCIFKMKFLSYICLGNAWSYLAHQVALKKNCGPQ